MLIDTLDGHVGKKRKVTAAIPLYPFIRACVVCSGKIGQLFRAYQFARAGGFGWPTRRLQEAPLFKPIHSDLFRSATPNGSAVLQANWKAPD
jgi:hypothetical protein